MDQKYNELAFYTLNLQDSEFIHQYVVDAYTAQNATENTKSIALTFALAGLCLAVEKNYTGSAVQNFHTLMSNHKITWPKFKIPHEKGKITIDMILSSEEGENRKQMISKWCQSVWEAYKENHHTVREVLTYYFEIQDTKHFKPKR
jgi:hypothetical protein